MAMNAEMFDNRDSSRGRPEGRRERGRPIVNYQQRGVNYCGEKPANRLGIASLLLAIVALGLARVPLGGPVVVMGLGLVGGALGVVGLIAALSGLRSSVGFPLAGIVACGHAFIVGLVFTMGSAAAMRNETAQATPWSRTAAARTPEGSPGMTAAALNTGLGGREAEDGQLLPAGGMNFEPLQWRGVRTQLLRPMLPAYSPAPAR